MTVHIYAWKTGLLTVEPDGFVEFHTVDRAEPDSPDSLGVAEQNGKKESEMTLPWSDVHIFQLEVPDYVMEIVHRRVRRHLENPSLDSNRESYVKLQLRTDQFRVVSCHKYEEGHAPDSRTAFADAQIISTDIPWYLIAARWIGEHIWGLGWLEDWARSAISSIPMESVVSQCVYFNQETKAPIGGGGSPRPGSSPQHIHHPSPTGSPPRQHPAESPSSSSGTSPSLSSSSEE